MPAHSMRTTSRTSVAWWRRASSGVKSTSFSRGAAWPSASATSSISSTPSWKLKGRGTRTPAAASRYSASTSALCQAASCAWRPNFVPLAIARAWRVFFTLRFSV